MSLHDEWPLINIIMPLGPRLSRAAQYAYVLAGWLVYCVAPLFFFLLCAPASFPFFLLFFFLLRINPFTHPSSYFLPLPAGTSLKGVSRAKISGTATHKRQDLHLRKVITPAIFCRHAELWRPCHKRNGSKRWLFVWSMQQRAGREMAKSLNLVGGPVCVVQKKAISEALLK